MSSELKLHAVLSKSDQLQQFLFRANKVPSWLQKCVISMSPLCDTAIIAHGSALVCLRINYSEGNEPVLSVSKQWDASENGYYGEDITSALCVPLAIITPHSLNSPDWTCVAVGFSSGFVRFFTEDMELLMAEQLHQEPVLQLKAIGHRVKKDSKQECSEKSEMIFAVYPSVICTIPGFSLFQTLRGCRGQVALKLARGESKSPAASIDLYEKYSICSKPIRDACFVGQSAITMFDHLVSSSLNEGFFSKYRPSPPHYNIVVSTGTANWAQFHHTLEGVAAPLELSDVAKTVWNKLPSWIGIGGSKPKEVQYKPAQNMKIESRLLDRRREGRNVAGSLDGSLLAVTDSFGRVTLLDARTGVAIAMWKGYRDAECAFLEVQEELSKAHRHRHQKTSTAPKIPRCVQLLIIYAPKKGLLEIFPLRHGPRVAALKVSKYGRLVYIPHGLMGFSTPPKKASSSHNVPVCFLSDEGVFEIIVPFHCALLDTSARTKDLHLMKKLNTIFKEHEDDESLAMEVMPIFKELQTYEIQKQCVQFISKHRRTTPSLFIVILDFIITSNSNTDISEDSPVYGLLLHCRQVRKACDLYQYLLENANLESKSLHSDISLAQLLCVSESDASAIVKFIENTRQGSESSRDTKVTFHDGKKQTLSTFLHWLDFSDSEFLTPRTGISDEEYCSLGEMIFGGVSERLASLESWKKHVRSSSMSASLLAHSLLHYWLQRPVLRLDHDMHSFITLLRTVISISEDPVAAVRTGVESPWWTELRNVISRSRKASSSLLLAICCRAVSITTEREYESKNSEKSEQNTVDTSDEGWERISADTWQWDMLICNLEDVAVVNKVIMSKPLKRCDEVLEQNEVSLDELLSRGEEALSQHIAKWICLFKINPNLLVDKTDAEFQTIQEVQVVEHLTRPRFKGGEHLISPLVEILDDTEAGTETENKVLGYLNMVKGRFPYSLTSSVLLSHVGWELLSTWQRDPSDVAVLSSAVKCLLLIPNAHLKAGICGLVWSTYMKIQFEGITRLLCQVGKLPTDVLCTQETGLPRSAVAPFLGCAEKLLSAILDAIAERPQEKLVKRREALWRDSPSGIVSVALSRPSPCQDSVHLHHQITSIILMVCALEVKEKNVLSSLLDSLKNELFGDLTDSKRIFFKNLQTGDSILFILRRCISAAVQTIQEIECEDSASKLDASTANHWLRVCNQIATFWQFPLDVIRRQHVCELYSCGYDRLAEEVLPLVNETQLLASALLVLAGQRLQALIAASPEPQIIISSLSPKLTSWLEILESGNIGVKRGVSIIEDTALLVNRILQWLPEDHNDVHIANLLAESLIGMEVS